MIRPGGRGPPRRSLTTKKARRSQRMNAILKIRHRDLRVEVNIEPNMTLMQLFVRIDVSTNYLGTRTMSDITFESRSFNFETNGNELQRLLGEFEEINWDDDEVCITFDAGHPVIGWIDEYEEMLENDHQSDQSDDEETRNYGQEMQRIMIEGYKVMIGLPGISDRELRSLQDRVLRERFES